MREEWTRLQTLADAKSSRESHLWALLRGLLNRGGGSSSSSSGGGRKKTASGSSSVSSSVSNHHVSTGDLLISSSAASSGRTSSRHTPIKDLVNFGPPRLPERCHSLSSKPPISASSSPMSKRSLSGAVPKRNKVRPGDSSTLNIERSKKTASLDDYYDVPRKLSLDHHNSPFHFVPVKVAEHAKIEEKQQGKVKILEGDGDEAEKRGAAYENVIIE